MIVECENCGVVYDETMDECSKCGATNSIKFENSDFKEDDSEVYCISCVNYNPGNRVECMPMASRHNWDYSMGTGRPFELDDVENITCLSAQRK